MKKSAGVVVCVIVLLLIGSAAAMSLLDSRQDFDIDSTNVKLVSWEEGGPFTVASGEFSVVGQNRFGKVFVLDTNGRSVGTVWVRIGEVHKGMKVQLFQRYKWLPYVKHPGTGLGGEWTSEGLMAKSQ